MWGAQALHRVATRAYCARQGLVGRALRGWQRKGVGEAATGRHGSRRGIAAAAAAAATATAAAAAATGCCVGWQVADSAALARCDAPTAAYDEIGQPSNDLTREVQEWLARRRSTGDSRGAEAWVSQVEKAAAKSLRGKRVLVFVNPECGPKQAKQYIEAIIRPMLTALGCLSVEIFETDDKHNAMELLRTADMSELDAVRSTCPLSHIRRRTYAVNCSLLHQVLVVGGSGTVNEVVQGLYYASQISAEEPPAAFGAAKRSAREPLSMPIGIIPAGREVRVVCTAVRDATLARSSSILLSCSGLSSRQQRSLLPVVNGCEWVGVCAP